MIKNYPIKLINYFDNLEIGYQSALVGCLCSLISISLAGPDLYTYLLMMTHDSSGYSRYYDTFVPQVSDIFFRPVDNNWHGGFLGYRILIPLLAKIFGLGPVGAVGLIWLAGWASLSLVYRYLAKITNARTAFFFTLGLSLTSMGWGSHSYLGYPDAVSWLLIMTMLVHPSWVIWLICPLLALFNDERMIVSIPFILAILLYKDRDDLFLILKKSLFYLSGTVLAIAIGYLGREAIRVGFIGNHPIMDPIYPTSGIGAYQLRFYIEGLLISFGALWILPLAAVFTQPRDTKRSRAYWLGLFIYSLSAIIFCAFPLDFCRSLACIFPFFILCIIRIYQSSPKSANQLLLWICLFMLVTPKLDQVGGTILWVRPLPVGIFEYQTKRSLFTRIKAFYHDRRFTRSISSPRD